MPVVRNADGATPYSAVNATGTVAATDTWISATTAAKSRPGLDAGRLDSVEGESIFSLPWHPRPSRPGSAEARQELEKDPGPSIALAEESMHRRAGACCRESGPRPKWIWKQPRQITNIILHQTKAGPAAGVALPRKKISRLIPLANSVESVIAIMSKTARMLGASTAVAPGLGPKRSRRETDTNT